MLFGLFTVNQLIAFIGIIAVPFVIFILNYLLRRLSNESGYFTSFADLLLLLLVFDASSIVFPSGISLIIRNPLFKEALVPILLMLFLFTLIIWIYIVLSVEDKLLNAICNARKNASSLQQIDINWPWESLRLAWGFTSFITAGHLGLLFMP
jgi:hypothetical protein